MTGSKTSNYFNAFSRTVDSTEFTDRSNSAITRDDAFSRITNLMQTVTQSAGTIFFCGNGGSAGICSHMATDFSKNGQVRALAMNDSSSLTCLANDFGFEFVFSKQIEIHAGKKDALFAISSSGKSQNILNAVESAVSLGMPVVTFSGFLPENSLRQLGDINVYVPAEDYGFVEVAHLCLIHAALDIHMGWPEINYP